jgi:DNA (cytosine-5)-methyltransferase 1
MRAIDLYSGVGGWSLGLSMAGVSVESSYEWWGKANLTNERNNGHKIVMADVRGLPLSGFPQADIVVGSPPCTQFSLANRGGKGNILEGLKDVEKFLEVVEAVGPRFWAMENIPRLAAIMRSELNQGGVLHRFCGLNPTILVLDASEWGVPQRRQRCIIGNFNSDLLLAYRDKSISRTLGCVLRALSSPLAHDPVYGTEIPQEALVDHEKELSLSWEEERINRETKTHHPVYNNMSFPDRLDRPSRTVTATCTRVSRESIVVPEGDGFRRLSLRERACLQSFPVAYQFYGDTHPQKQKMIGNAIPPLLSYHIAHAMLGTLTDDLPSPSESIKNFVPPSAPKATRPDKPGYSFAIDRKFRAAIPGLRFKSGVRFELSNSFPGPEWSIKFFYGNSKNIKEIILGSGLLGEIKSVEGTGVCVSKATNALFEIGGIMDSLDPVGLQGAWSHTREYKHPYELVDSLGRAVELFMSEDEGIAESVVSGIMASRNNPQGCKKVIRHAKAVFSGLLIGSIFNDTISQLPTP